MLPSQSGEALVPPGRRGGHGKKGKKRTGFEVKRHVLSDDPANNDQEGSDTKSDLDRGADGNAHGQVHLVTESDDDGGYVLCSVAHNRDEDQADEGFADVGALDDVVDASNQVIGADGNKNGHDDENNAGSDGTHAGLVVTVFGVFFGGLPLGVEEVAVGAELEDKVERIENEQNDGCAPRENKNAAILFIRASLVEDAVQL